MFRLAVVAMLVALAVGIPTSFDNDIDAYWKSFKTHHNKHYGDNESIRLVTELLSSLSLLEK